MTTSRISCRPEGRHRLERFSRLASSCALGGEALARWCAARIAVAGMGNIGPVFAVEALRSGAEVWICDPEDAEEVNLGTQDVRVGRPKVEAVLARAEAIAPGRMSGDVVDVRHAGIGHLRRFDLLVDATDDPSLTWALVQISNGLAVPLLRLAIDGSGEREVGRVAVSHGGGGRACSACPWSLEDLNLGTELAPCPNGDPERPPTLAGNAIGTAISGVGLHQAQRLLGGRTSESALDHELILDLDHGELHNLNLGRSSRCLSAHRRWQLMDLDRDAGETTVGQLFELASAELGGDDVELEPWMHPLMLEAWCSCGAIRRAAGTRWATPPPCRVCRKRTRWSLIPTLSRFNAAQAQLMGIAERTWASLGLPPRDAMVTARRRGSAALRFLFS